MIHTAHASRPPAAPGDEDLPPIPADVDASLDTYGDAESSAGIEIGREAPVALRNEATSAAAHSRGALEIVIRRALRDAQRHL